MFFAKFLNDLLYSGQVKIHSHDAPSEDDRSKAIDLLVDFESTWRLNCPNTPPIYSTTAGVWAAEQFFRAAQFLMFRDIPGEEVESSLSMAPAPDDQLPLNHYSVDLVFRFLPDFANLSQSIAKDDPLSVHLRHWCRQWPLSSVGVRSWDEDVADKGDRDAEQTRGPVSRSDQLNLVGFISNATLRQMYIDRILDRNDRRRIDHPIVADEIKRVVGDHPGLHPLAGELTQPRNVIHE